MYYIYAIYGWNRSIRCRKEVKRGVESQDRPRRDLVTEVMDLDKGS